MMMIMDNLAKKKKHLTRMTVVVVFYIFFNDQIDRMLAL